MVDRLEARVGEQQGEGRQLVPLFFASLSVFVATPPLLPFSLGAQANQTSTLINSTGRVSARSLMRSSLQTQQPAPNAHCGHQSSTGRGFSFFLLNPLLLISPGSPGLFPGCSSSVPFVGSFSSPLTLDVGAPRDSVPRSLCFSDFLSLLSFSP